MEKGRTKVGTRIFTIIAATFLLAPGLALGMASFEYPLVSPVISLVQGDVRVLSEGAAELEPAEVGRVLASGDTIKTGTASSAEISFASGKMRLYEHSVIIIPEIVDESDKRDIHSVTLDEGTGIFKIKKRGAKKKFKVNTTNICAGVKGTLYAVKHEKPMKRSRVFVFSGSVEVTDEDITPDTATKLKRGQSIDVDGNEGFGIKSYFKSTNPWNKRKLLDSFKVPILSKNPFPITDRYKGDGDGDDRPDCDNVYDRDGDPIVY